MASFEAESEAEREMFSRCFDSSTVSKDGLEDDFATSDFSVFFVSDGLLSPSGPLTEDLRSELSFFVSFLDFPRNSQSTSPLDTPVSISEG